MERGVEFAIGITCFNMMSITPIAPVSPVSSVDMIAWARFSRKAGGSGMYYTPGIVVNRDFSEEKKNYPGDLFIYGRRSIFRNLPKTGLILDRYI
jgi:hypothetical protein